MEHLTAVKDLVLWAREQRVQITRLKVGDVELDFADIQLADDYAQVARRAAQSQGAWSPPTPPSKEDIYAELAGDVGPTNRRERVEEDPT